MGEGRDVMRGRMRELGGGWQTARSIIMGGGREGGKLDGSVGIGAEWEFSLG